MMTGNPYKEIDALLDQHNAPNFVALAYGDFQIQSVNAFFMSEMEKGKSFQGIFITDTEKIGKESCAVLAPEEFELFPFAQFPRWSGWKDKLKFWNLQRQKQTDVNDPFYVIFLSKIHINESLIIHLREKYPARSILLVVTTEGLQSYVGESPFNMGRFYAMGKKGKGSKIMGFIKGAFICLYKECELRFLAETGFYVPFNLFSQEKDGSLVTVETVREYMKKAFELGSASKGVKLPKDYYKNVVLFSTQPFVEEKRMVDADERILTALYKTIRGLGYRAMVKPHPMEKQPQRYLRLGFDIDMLGQGIAQEYLLAAAEEKPVAIVSYGSTAMVTGNLFWNIPAISIFKCIAEEMVSPYFYSAFKTMLDLFCQIYSPENVEQFEKIMQTIKEGERMARDTNENQES